MPPGDLRPAWARRAPRRDARTLRSTPLRLLCSLLPWVLRSGAILAGRDPGEARRLFGAASQIPECATDLPIDIHYQSERRCCEMLKVTSSTRKPGANDLGLWMTTTSDNPNCPTQRSRIQYESSLFGRRALSLSRTQQLRTQGCTRVFDSRSVS